MSAKAGGGSGSRGSSQSNSSARAAIKRATAAKTSSGGGSGSGEATQEHLAGSEDVLMDAQSQATELLSSLGISAGSPASKHGLDTRLSESPVSGAEGSGTPRAGLRPGGAGGQVTKWKVTVQQATRPAHCSRCKQVFGTGDIRLQSSKNAKAGHHYHMGCVDALLPPSLDEIEGAEELEDEPQDRLIGFISQRATDGGASTATTQEPDSGGSPLDDFDEEHTPIATIAGIARWDWWDSISWNL